MKLKIPLNGLRALCAHHSVSAIGVDARAAKPVHGRRPPAPTGL